MHGVSETAFHLSIKALQMDFVVPFNQVKT